MNDAERETLERRIDELCQENEQLRKWCVDLLDMAENGDPEWLHWPEVHDALRKLGVDA